MGSFIITFITICMIFRNDINFILTSKKIEREFGKTSENSYFIEDYFEFVDNYESAEVHSREEIINSIYYLINSGVEHSKRYCAKDYDTCYEDIESISSDTNLLSVLNNYVHPYNSFESIIFNFSEDVIDIEIKHTYTKEERELLNSKIDSIINQNINNNMTTKEKVRAIHDYIINTTTYDTLKTDDINDTTYKSNTAYGVLVQGYGICSGYSDAMKIFLDKLNIVNYKICNDQHIWNLVLLDGEWLHLDLTWDDPVSDKNITRDNYFLITTRNMVDLNDEVHYYNDDVFSEVKY